MLNVVRPTQLTDAKCVGTNQRRPPFGGHELQLKVGWRLYLSEAPCASGRGECARSDGGAWWLEAWHVFQHAHLVLRAELVSADVRAIVHLRAVRSVVHQAHLVGKTATETVSNGRSDLSR